jgi:hypothetical protein
MGAFLEIGLELIPQLGRLAFDVPFHIPVARAEVAFFGPRRFLVPAHVHNDPREPMAFRHPFEGILLEHAATPDARRLARRVGSAAKQHLIIHAQDELEVPLGHQPVPVFNHAVNLTRSIHMHQRKGDMAKKGLACHPEQNRRVFADAPQHRQVLEPVKGLAHDVDALVLKFSQMIHGAVID